VYRWAIDTGAVEIIHHQHLHATVATVRSKADWSLIGDPLQDTIVVPEGTKRMLLLGSSAHALGFEHRGMAERFRALAGVLPVDYPNDFNGHVTLGRGPTFRQPRAPYDGKLVFGPEVIEPFLAGISFPRGIPIDRNQYREQLGLPLHDDDEAMRAEHLSRVRKEPKKKYVRGHLHE
jgi:hypothetical protein